MKVNLLFLIMILLTSFSAISAEKHVVRFGKISYERKSGEFYFVYKNGKQELFHPVHIKDKETFRIIKKLNGKFVHLKGDVLLVKELVGEMPKFSRKMSVKWVEEFTLNKLKLASASVAADVYEKPDFERLNYALLDRKKRISSSERRGGIALSDNVANALILGGGAVLGAVVAPVALIPVAVAAVASLI